MGDGVAVWLLDSKRLLCVYIQEALRLDVAWGRASKVDYIGAQYLVPSNLLLYIAVCRQYDMMERM